jgi:hypothetical protein
MASLCSLSHLYKTEPTPQPMVYVKSKYHVLKCFMAHIPIPITLTHFRNIIFTNFRFKTSDKLH